MPGLPFLAQRTANQLVACARLKTSALRSAITALSMKCNCNARGLG